MVKFYDHLGEFFPAQLRELFPEIRTTCHLEEMSPARPFVDLFHKFRFVLAVLKPFPRRRKTHRGLRRSRWHLHGCRAGLLEFQSRPPHGGVGPIFEATVFKTR